MAQPRNVQPGTAHYHAVKATEEFAAFAEAMRAEAHRTQAKRDERERDRKEHTTYARAEESNEQET